jgi:hypothetical protein
MVVTVNPSWKNNHKQGQFVLSLVLRMLLTNVPLREL